VAQRKGLGAACGGSDPWRALRLALVLADGDAPTTGFVLKFGAVPLPLGWCNPNEEAELLLPAELLPPPAHGAAGGGVTAALGGLALEGTTRDEGDASDTSRLRARVLAEFGFAAGETFLLSEEELVRDDDTTADEDEAEGALPAVRLLCMLRIGSAAFLAECAACAERGALPGCGLEAELAFGALAELRPPSRDLAAVFVELVDANLRRLPTRSSMADLARCDGGAAGHLEVVALHARIRQREQLGRWRRRLCREHGVLTECADDFLDQEAS
jgi:hypothetical protein